MTKASEKYDYNSIFPQRFRALMEERQTSQLGIADICNVRRQSVSQWFNGETRPDILSLVKIAQTFNVSTDYLLGLTDVKSTDTATQSLCATLGLSEEAIDLLTCNEATQYHKHIIEFYANIEGFKQHNIDGVEVGRGIARLNAERITACINQMLSEYIQDSINAIKSDIPGDSVLEHLVAFYELLNETPSPKYGDIDIDDEEILHAIVSEHLINSRTYDTGTCGVKLSELVINSQILEISSKLNQMKHDKMKERGRNENEA